MSDLVGQSASVVIRKLAENICGGSVLHFFSPAPVPPLGVRLKPYPDLHQFLRLVHSLRTKIGMEFWESASLLRFRAGASTDSLLSAACFHNSTSIRSWQVKVEDLSEVCLYEMERESLQDSSLSVRSSVTHDDYATSHIPMLDFACPAEQENLVLVTKIIRRLEVGGGFVLGSGRSYHFYGSRLLSLEELPCFLGRALLFGSVVDRRWIAHQLVRGYCSLRVSRRKDTEVSPTIESVLD
jgi:hypothetical protein